MLVIDRYARRELFVADGKIKAAMDERMSAKAEDAAAAAKANAGWVEGYAAVWDNVDSQFERMLKGCFARSIKEAVAARKVKLMARHFRDGGDAFECIGTIVEAREDDIGLWIRAEFASSDDAQSIRAKIVEGHIKGLSVGYMAIRFEIVNEEQEDGTTIQTVNHTECKLVEVTVTVRPANELAGITAAKSLSSNSPVAQVIGKTVAGSSAEAPAATTTPPDLPRMKREIELRRKRLALFGIE